jgi:hypothetical protein
MLPFRSVNAHESSRRNVRRTFHTDARTPITAEQVDAVEHHTLPGLYDADDRVDQRRLGRRSVGIEHRKPEKCDPTCSTASFTLPAAVATASAPCSAALSIFSPARSAGPFCSQAAAPSAVAATSTARTIRIDRIVSLPSEWKDGTGDRLEVGVVIR